MKHISNSVFLLLLSLVTPQLFGQSFWTEDFSNGCTSLCTTYSGTNGTWTVSNTDTNGITSNSWFFSSAENGNPAGACSSNSGTDQSLHIGNVSGSGAASLFCPAGDCGAAYDDSGPNEITNKRAESPTINCSGYSNVNLSFNFIEFGETINDDGSVWYYDGSLWTLLSNTPKTIACGAFGSTWTMFTIPLPPSANNNPNVKIGFNWTNNGDGNATDPSFAVDDITLSVSSVNVSNLSISGSGISIFPNPASDHAKIEILIKENSEVLLELTDLTGKNLETIINGKRQAGTYKYELDFSDVKYSSGIYFLKLRTNDQFIIHKLVIIK